MVIMESILDDTPNMTYNSICFGVPGSRKTKVYINHKPLNPVASTEPNFQKDSTKEIQKKITT